MDKIKLVKILKGNFSIIDEVNVSEKSLFDDHVTIHPNDVKGMLLSYLNNEVTDADLTKWAGFISMRSEYGPPNWEDDEMADYYEDMMYVIQRLSTPEIDGKIDKSIVKNYLKELEKYTD